MPAVRSCIIEPIWEQFSNLLTPCAGSSAGAGPTCAGRATLDVGPEILWETLIVTLFWPFRRSSPRTKGVGA